jgi:A/G-specific adenine glycosylase
VFQRRLLAWYDQHKRDLPWRHDHDPYRVWISEIMLQQTRVAAVLDHYRRFLQRFPTVQSLAAARESSVLTAWSGLGYYRRARMLHAAAKTIAKERKGEFPRSAAQWRALSGIGRYTASAIASIAFGEPVAVVDGNVERVLARFLGKRLAGEALWRTAQETLDRKRPGDFNQALMELGATVCLPRQPMCLVCPIVASCATQGELERSEKGTRQRKQEVHYALDCRNGSVFLQRRAKHASLMPGMWELPEIAHPNGDPPLLTLKHSITNTDYVVRVASGPAPKSPRGRWVRRKRLSALPLTGLARKILSAAGVM